MVSGTNLQHSATLLLRFQAKNITETSRALFFLQVLCEEFHEYLPWQFSHCLTFSFCLFLFGRGQVWFPPRSHSEHIIPSWKILQSPDWTNLRKSQSEQKIVFVQVTNRIDGYLSTWMIDLLWLSCIGLYISLYVQLDPKGYVLFDVVSGV